MGDAVELDEHDARHVGAGGALRPSMRLPCHALVEPRVVVDGEQRAEQRGHDHQTDDDGQRGPEAVDVHARKEVEQEQDERGVENDRSEPECHDGQRHDEERERRPDHGVADADHESREHRVPERVDREPRQDRGEQPEAERGDHGEHHGAPHHVPPRGSFAGGSDDSRFGWRGLVHRTPRSSSACRPRAQGGRRVVRCWFLSQTPSSLSGPPRRRTSSHSHDPGGGGLRSCNGKQTGAGSPVVCDAAGGPSAHDRRTTAPGKGLSPVPRAQRRRPSDARSTRRTCP